MRHKLAAMTAPAKLKLFQPKPQGVDPYFSALSRREIRWGQALLATFLLLVSLPYLWCFLLSPPGMTWGGFLFSSEDQNVHLMWARQAQDGAFFMRDLFTTEGLVSGDHPLFFNLFAFGLGWFSRVTHIDGAFGYHIARVAFAGLFVHQLHRLLVAATGGAPEKEAARLGALALAVLTTGGGFWLSAFPGFAGKIILLDHPSKSGFLPVPEAFALLSGLIYPLNIASFALICFLLRALIEGKKPLMAFFAALILSNIHTYDALPLLLACGTGLFWSLVRREPLQSKPVWSAVSFGLLLPILYQALVFRGSEEFRVKALTATSPPVIWGVLSTFAPLLILSACAWRARWAKGTSRWLIVYALSVLGLVYLPKSPSLALHALFEPHQIFDHSFAFSFARKMLEGFQIPLLVFAGAGLAALPARKFTAPLVIAVCAVSPLVFFDRTLSGTVENRVRGLMPPFYLSDADAGALLALQKVPDKNAAVLCLPLVGSYLPRATGLFTYTGHWAETLHLNRKLGQENRFYSARMSPDEARAFLKSNRIGFIIESPFERAISPNPSVAASLGFQPIYSAQSPDERTVVYKVK